MRTCVLCVHWWFDSGMTACSELTPGYEWSSGCSKTHWRVKGSVVDQEEYRLCLLKATKCTEYREVDVDDME